jgi:cystathionine beta-synthase
MARLRTLSVSDLVGQTPLVRLRSVERRQRHRLWGKCEFMNPGGSVKDRIAGHILNRAERAGLLVRGSSTLVEATAGNTGVALAMAAAGRGYGLIVTMSSKMGPEKVALMKAWGADVVICPYGLPPDSPESFIATARAIAAERPRSYYVDQFNNPWNREAHERTTGPELLAAFGGRLAAVVAGAGTGGTLMGIARALAAARSRTSIVMADPEGSILADWFNGRPAEPSGYRVEGIGGDFVPGLLERDRITEAVTISDEESMEMCRRLRRDEGLFVGGSSGCAVAAAVRYASQLPGDGRDIVALLPDSGNRYLSTIHSADRSDLGVSA